MGSTCKNICKPQLAEKELNINVVKKAKSKKQQQQHSNGDSKTDPYCSSQLLIKEESIGDESKISQTLKDQPQFVKTKQINSIAIPTDRKNRFLNDQEQEVKYLIKQNLLKDQEELKQLQIEFEKQKQLQQEEKDRQEREMEKTQQELENQFSFQNSIKQTQIEQTYVQNTSNPYLPRQTSQFAPKKADCDTVSQKSQISKAPTIPLKDQQVSPKSDMMRKSALKKSKQSKEEVASNNASIGTPKNETKKKYQQDTFDKMFSECSFDERSQSGSHKTVKSVKSILKKNRSFSQRSISMGKNSIQSSHTVFKMKQTKKVRFSNDTNFNNERKGVPKLKRNWWEF
ncbi:unnamed protein product (macronuclear) [Paramecium tetraurelia]|uniref:Uncharacterized protein n=1 Tax=Paramecium tetraurelia TaxID=5888 RepID=A0EFJ1_PARTE|nr:uncharacterized protein GSPATT00026405001 [Paramecium tetraurelia]CAK94082.1 unnamed protein product [Paramecium tetraurelia]|eukprot:XP_001461455.1 hypothetical protein (macronuclear) [Paramecium tetraurelia strain d4-2]